MAVEVGAGVPADPGDAGSDPAPTQMAANPRIVVALVAVQLDRPSPGATPAARLIAGIESRIGSTTVSDPGPHHPWAA